MNQLLLHNCFVYNLKSDIQCPAFQEKIIQLIKLLQKKTYIIRNFSSTHRKQMNSVQKNKTDKKIVYLLRMCTEK